MKGTLISSDFIKDASDNLRLLEINTDTVCSDSYLTHSNDWSGLFTILSDNNITELHCNYKPEVQQNIINDLSSSLSVALPSVSFSHTQETLFSIYPELPPDSDSIFILRLSYDENAILDSNYTADNTNTLTLMYDNDATSSIVPFYYKLSDDYVRDCLLREVQSSDKLPDLALKSKTYDNSSVNFIKLPQSGSSLDKVTNFIDSAKHFSGGLSGSNIVSSDSFIMNFLINSSSIENNIAESTRVYSIIHGSNLTSLTLGALTQQAEFTLPTTEQYGWDKSSNDAYVDYYKHSYEFGTSKPKELFDTYGGLFETENIVMADSSSASISTITSESLVRSLYIPTLPDGDNPLDYINWKVEGNTLPAGTILSQSVATADAVGVPSQGYMYEMTLDGVSDKKYVAPNSAIIVYSEADDNISFKVVESLSPISHSLVDDDGTLTDITDIRLIIQNTLTGSFYSIDVEETDTYITEGVLGITLHNCFVAGTQILLSNGDVKLIENIVEGDEVLSYNVNSKENSSGVVGSIKSRQSNEIYTLTFSNGDSIQTTHEHPFYVIEKGFVKVSGLSIGDECLTSQGNQSSISEIIVKKESTKVYNLYNVEGDENFFANNILVHNKPGGFQ